MANYYCTANPGDNFFPDYKRHIKLNDENFIKRWLPAAKNSINHSSGVKNSNTNMFDTRSLMLEVFDASKRIEETESYLRNNVSALSDVLFSEKLEDINKMKADIDVKLKMLSDKSVMASLKTKLTKRYSKRQRLRRRKIETKAQKLIQRQLNDSKSKDIDKWLEDKKMDLLNKQKELDMKVKADAVLKDVNRRKAEARKNISLLDALCKLRIAREKSATGRGECIDAVDKQTFVSSFDKLKLLWNNALINYESEEKKLKDMLNDNSKEIQPNSEPTINKANAIISQWKRAMFGDPGLMPQRNFNGNLYHFISIRQQWDQYISHDADGSRIPFRWITPSPLTNKWKEYFGNNLSC